MKQTITKLQYVLDEDILRSAFSKAGYRERECMMHAREITVKYVRENLIIRFIHVNGQQFAEFEANSDRWVN